VTEEGGSFPVSVGYSNKIESTGDASNTPSEFE
jgi:hypothetical protein